MPQVHAKKAPAPAIPTASPPVGLASGTLASGPIAASDLFDVHSARASRVVPPVTTPKDVSIPGIRESFPIQDLSLIDGRGLVGDLFLLDGGALDNMKLQVRRVREGGVPGFELNFRLQPAAYEKLAAALAKAGAKSSPIEFPGRSVTSDGYLEKGSKIGRVSAHSTYAPSNLENDDEAWMASASGVKGGTVSLVHDRAAPSAARLVRIHLSGDDATCTKQLDGLVKTLGLGHVFAPPTDATKQRYALFRALWQAKHGEAKKLGAEPEKVSIGVLEKTLEASGLDAARRKGLRLTDVSPTHFTVIDPEQARRMIDAGARYLYSTVESPDHVADILEKGQKSSLRRYLDGFIFDGMSTGEDFCSGGGVGVFTRMVTESAILDGESWTGRRYKIILRPDILARTDWFGHEGDEFGQAHGLKAANFGLALLEEIGTDEGNYKDYNELIFRDSIGPQYIGRVVATSEADRDELIETLEKRGVKPASGIPLEELVIVAPEFMFYGPSPHDGRPPEDVAKEALAEAKKGKRSKARWFLTAGPEGKVKAELELALLRMHDSELQEMVFGAMKARGRLAGTPDQVTGFLEALQASKAEADEELLSALVHEVPGPLLGSDSPLAAKILKKDGAKATSYAGPFGMSNEEWVKVFEVLAPSQVPGAPTANFQLALDLAAKRLLDKRDLGFMRFLERHPLVVPQNREAFLEKELKALGKGPASFELRCFMAQAREPEELADLELRLIKANTEHAADLLERWLGKHKRFGSDPADLALALKKLPAEGPVRKLILASAQEALVVAGEPSLLSMLDAKWKATPQSKKLGPSAWPRLLEAHLPGGQVVDSPALRWVLARGASALFDQDEEEAKVSLHSVLAKLPALFPVKSPQSFAQAAVKELSDQKSDAALRLGWALAHGPAELQGAAVSALLRAGSAAAEKLLEWAVRRLPERRLPLTASQFDAISKELGAAALKSKGQSDNWFFRNQSRFVVASASPETVQLLDQLYQKRGQYFLGLDFESFVPTLTALGPASHPGASEARSWLLSRFGEGALRWDAPNTVFDLFDTLKVSPTMVGMEGDALLERIRSIGTDYIYELESDHDDDDGATKAGGLPRSILWLLSAPAEQVDPERVKQVLAKVVSWRAESSDDWSRFLEKLAEALPSEWKKPIAAAKKKVDAT